MDKLSPADIPPGDARCPGPSTRDIIMLDRITPDEALLADSYEFLGDSDIEYERYTSLAYHQSELEKLWPNVWQFACREEHLTFPNDTFVYDIGNYSIIVTRLAEGGLKAYINSCKHRGMQLRPAGSRGALSQIRCPFHGFSWEMDGALKAVPCAWDFPHIKKSEFALDEVSVESWGGFIYINMSQNPVPLLDYLEVMPEHFKNWRTDRRALTLHIEKILPANWKIAQEAFLESYHVMATHPQGMPAAGDANCQYDVFGENVTRFWHTIGSQSPHIKRKLTEKQILKAMGGDDLGITLKEGDTARETFAEFVRGAYGAQLGVDLSEKSVSELIDSIEYHVFPNMMVFPGITLPMVYRFRPNGDDVDSCIFDLMFLTPLADDVEMPRAPDPIKVDVTTRFVDVPEMDPGLAFIYDQDVENLERQTRGIKASRKNAQTLGNYQEVRIRRFNMTLDKYMSV